MAGRVADCVVVEADGTGDPREAAGVGGRGRIQVALIEPQPARRRQLYALLAPLPRLDVYPLRDAAAYDEIYGPSGGPDVALVGLDGGR